MLCTLYNCPISSISTPSPSFRLRAFIRTLASGVSDPCFLMAVLVSFVATRLPTLILAYLDVHGTYLYLYTYLPTYLYYRKSHHSFRLGIYFPPFGFFACGLIV